MNDCSETSSNKFGCEQVIEHLFEYVDSQLDDNMYMRYKAHLELCVMCKDCIDAEKHVRVVLRKKCCDKAPNDLKVKIIDQLLLLNELTIDTSDNDTSI